MGADYFCLRNRRDNCGFSLGIFWIMKLWRINNLHESRRPLSVNIVLLCLWLLCDEPFVILKKIPGRTNVIMPRTPMQKSNI